MCLQGQSHFIADFFFFFCRKLRKYIGPETPSPDSVEAKEWADLSEKIRLSADDVFTKIQSAFGLKEGVDFVPFFANAVAEFNMATQSFAKLKLAYLVADPTDQIV